MSQQARGSSGSGPYSATEQSTTARPSPFASDHDLEVGELEDAEPVEVLLEHDRISAGGAGLDLVGRVLRVHRDPDVLETVPRAPVALRVQAVLAQLPVAAQR